MSQGGSLTYLLYSRTELFSCCDFVEVSEHGMEFGV